MDSDTLPLMSKPLEKEFNYYLNHQDDLVAKYRGKYVVIKGDEVLGVYDDEIEAIRETQHEHELGTFLVQKCEPGIQTQIYHSRVAVA